MPEAEKPLHHIEIHGHEDGGRIVEHHFSRGNPDPYLFEPHEGHELIEHIKEHVGIRDDGSMTPGEGPSPADEEGKPDLAEQRATTDEPKPNFAQQRGR